jgi:hypothetical protein
MMCLQGAHLSPAVSLLLLIEERCSALLYGSWLDPVVEPGSWRKKLRIAGARGAVKDVASAALELAAALHPRVLAGCWHRLK